jgi:mRNA interferase MazF
VDNLDKPSVVASSLIQTLSWKDRKANFIAKAEIGVMDQVLVRIIPLIGADSVIEKFIE